MFSLTKTLTHQTILNTTITYFSATNDAPRPWDTTGVIAIGNCTCGTGNGCIGYSTTNLTLGPSGTLNRFYTGVQRMWASFDTNPFPVATRPTGSFDDYLLVKIRSGNDTTSVPVGKYTNTIVFTIIANP